jgi:Trypsin
MLKASPAPSPSRFSLRRSVRVPAIALAAFCAACSGEPGEDLEDLEESEPIDTLEQAFVGSSPAVTTVTSNENLSVPFVSAVKLNNGVCSGVKIGTNKFLTAGHCISESASSVNITNALSGNCTSFNTATEVADGVTRRKVFVHPSFQLGNTNVPPGSVTTNTYDVAVVEVVNGPTFASTAITGQLVPNGTAVTGVGYGLSGATTCSTSDGVKRKAALSSDADGTFGSTRSVHYLLDFGAPTSCDGDSGGPIFRGTGASARVVGVVSHGNIAAQPVNNSMGSTRISNVFEWIDNPLDSTRPGSAIQAALIADQSSVYLMNATLNGNQKPILNCAAQTGTGATSGTDVRLRFCDGPDGVFSGHGAGWRLLTSSSGGFKIVNRINGLCLGIDPATVNNPLPNVKVFSCAASGVALSRQSWTFTAATLANSLAGAYVIKSVSNSNLCMATASANGNENDDVVVSTSSCTSENRKWVITR